ncbi:MAG: MATE family efflux transporter [Candidatus Ancillula sp.]|nr:MATE family efflux transporter [Candidatus Ancillula sp.]
MKSNITQHEKKGLDRQILALALPILGQMVIEPIMLMADTVIVGHILTTHDLAALTVGTSVCGAILGVFIFMVVITNASVSRAFASADKKIGLQIGLNNIWLAAILGSITAVLTYYFTPEIVQLFNVDSLISAGAINYVHALVLGFPANMVIMAAIGVLRGFKQVKIPLFVAIGGVIINIPLNIMFLTLGHMGIYGSGLATAIALNLMMIALVIPIFKMALKTDAKKRPNRHTMFSSIQEGIPIFLRTLALWVAILFLTTLVGSYGTPAVAALQAVDSIWYFAILVMDSVSEAIISLISAEIGKRNFMKAKVILERALSVGLRQGILLGFVGIIASFIIPPLFSPDTQVHMYITCGILEASFVLWYASFAFIIDGCLIAAKDTKFMAFETMVSAIIYILVAVCLNPLFPRNPFGFLLLMFTYDGVFLGSRAFLSLYRYRNDRWLRNSMK